MASAVTMAHETIAVSNAVKELTAAGTTGYKQFEPFGCSAEIHVVTNTIRYWKDSSAAAASATVGLVAIAGAIITLRDYEEVKGFRCIRESADATIQVQYKTLGGHAQATQ